MIEQSCIRIDRPPDAESEPSQDCVSNDQSEDGPDKQHTSQQSGNGPVLYAPVKLIGSPDDQRAKEQQSADRDYDEIVSSPSEEPIG